MTNEQEQLTSTPPALSIDGVGVLSPSRDALDPEAFESEFRAAYPTLVFVAASECGQDLAEDAVQDAAFTAWSKISTFTPGTNFRAWMSTIVRNKARNHRRKQAGILRRLTSYRLQRDHQGTSGRTSAAATARPGDGDIRIGVNVELDDVIKVHVDALPPKQRSCLLLRVVLDHSYSEIAQLMDIPEATVRSSVMRAKQRLAQTVRPDIAAEVTHE